MAVGVSLSGARAKLDHGRAHLRALEEYFAASVAQPESQPLLRADFDSASGCHVLRIKTVPDFTPLICGISLRVGDVVHNFRSALDHLCWQLAMNCCGETLDTRHVTFPICQSPAGKGGLSSHKARRFIRPDDWAMIEEYQPYRGISGRPDSWNGQYIHQLAHLQQLSNEDKHRELPIVLLTSNEIATALMSPLPTGGFLSGKPSGQRAEPSEEDIAAIVARARDNRPDFTNSSYLIEAGAEVMRVRVSAKLQRVPSIDPAGFVRPRAGLTERRPLIDTLSRFANFVQLILDEFELYLRKNSRLA